ncbi:MAG: IS4 family transposase [Acidobacteria bacterium]|nr:IS4 family transposase [Acidobacteriota bacterium]MCA1640315.1 IS4 family transposase [Acidobacteriota bacterium]
MNKKPANLIASLESRDNTFTDLLQEFPADLIESAREFEAFRRGRKIRNVEQLFQMVLLYCGLDYSLRQTAGTLTLLGTRLSDQAVSERLSGCAAWLNHLLKQMLPELPPAVAEQTVGRWLLIDGSTIQVAGARSTSYRLHLAWDWTRQTIVEWIITDEKTGESLKLYGIEAADTVIADRGYARFKDIEYVLESGGEVIIRVAPHVLPMVDFQGGELKLADRLRASKHQQVSLKAAMKADRKRRQMTLHCFRLSAEKAAAARRRKIARARKNGITMKKETLEYAEWVIILSSYSGEQISGESIGRLYRLRWQIEIVIKRLKSVLEIDRLRGKKGSQISEVYLLGKSLYALLIAKRGGELKTGAEMQWRVWKMIREEITPQINQVGRWKKENLEQAVKQMKERKRKRKRQSEEASELLIKLLSVA